MTQRLSITCYEPAQAHTELNSIVWPAIKSMVTAGHRIVVEVRKETRSLEDNARLHVLLKHIANQIEWAGKKRDVETWKRLITAAWCRARNEQIEFLPAIDGHGVDIVFRRTSQLSKDECAELIEFLYAWAAESGVRFPARVDPETGEILS